MSDTTLHALTQVQEILNANLSLIEGQIFEMKILGSLPSISVTTIIPDPPSQDTVNNAGAALSSNKPIITSDTNNNAYFSGSVPSISNTNIAQLTVPSIPTAPSLDFGTAPVTDLPSVPSAPALQTTVVPVKPDLAIPSVPDLVNINIPILTTPTLPVFDQVFPAVPDSLLSPEDNFNYSEEDYISTELVNLRTLLNDDLANGGWGIDGHQDEEDLFERQRARMRRELIVDEEQLFDTFSARGFDVPQGDQIDQVRVLQKQTIDKLQEVELDISNSRADLIRKSRENVIAQTNTLTQTMTTYRGFMQQRLVQAAQFLAGHSINLFNAKVERHNLVINAYNSFVGAYQSQVNAAVSQIQISKIAIEAEALKSEINTNTVRLYQAQIESVTSLIRMYQIEVEAAKTLSDIERDKLELFKIEIDSYKSQIDAEVSKANLYAVQIGAEEIKARVYNIDVNAFEAEVRAGTAKVTSDAATAEVRIRENSLRLEQYRADIDRHRNEIEKRSSEINAVADANTTEASIYGSYASSYASYISSLVSQDKTTVDAFVKNSDIEALNGRFNAEEINKRIDTHIDVAKSAAKLYGEHSTAYAALYSSLNIEL